MSRFSRTVTGWVLATLLGIAALGATPTGAVAAPGWTTFQGQPDHNAVVETTGAAQRLPTAWHFQTAGSLVVAPSVVHGIAYLTSMDGHVYALSAATGHLLWSFRADNQIMSQALVVNGRVFFGSGNKGFSGAPNARVRGTGDSTVYALDAANGRLLWAQPVRGEAMPTPAYSGGALYEATGGGMFYAFDAISGRLLWSLAIGTRDCSPRGCRVMRAIDSMSSPIIDGSIAVFGATGGGRSPAYYGVDLSTHHLRWVDVFPGAWGGPDDLSPALAGGNAYVQVPYGSQSDLSGKRCATWPCQGAASWVPAGAGPITTAELAIDVRSGRQVWQHILGSGPARFFGGEEAGVATVVGNVTYVGAPELKGLWALDDLTGHVVWKSSVPAPIRAAPTVSGQRIYAVAEDGTLYVISRTTGSIEGSLRVGHPPVEQVSNYVNIPCTNPSATVVGASLLVAGGVQNTLLAMPMRQLP